MKVDKIIVHCSATEEGHDFRAGDIDVWHRNRGFKCIGYHWVIDLDGTVESGRHEGEVGAHCLGQNGNSIGICYIGGLRKGRPADTRTAAQRIAMDELIGEIRGRYSKLPVYGHRDFANKACPCFDASAEYGKV